MDNDIKINAGPNSVIDITEENGGKIFASGNIDGKLIIKASGAGQIANVSNMTIGENSTAIISSCQLPEDMADIKDLVARKLAEREERIRKKREEQKQLLHIAQCTLCDRFHYHHQ